MTPVGIRLNNPLNIRHSNDEWIGEAHEQPDPRFVAFNGPLYGIRAACRILHKYSLYGVNSVQELIAHWAPPLDDNPTSEYAEFVAKACGIAATDTINIVDYLPKIIPAMIQFENGENPYPDYLITQAIQMASPVK